MVAIDIQEDKLKNVVQEINDNGGEAIAVFIDVSKEVDWKQVVKEAVSKFTKIDVLINNAGISGDLTLNTVTTTEEEWKKVIGVNLKGVYLGMKNVIPEMQ